MNAAAYAVEGAAAANVSDAGIDISIAGIGIAVEQRGGTHDHAWLTITALWHVEFLPRLLNGMIAIRRQAFNGDDGLG